MNRSYERWMKQPGSQALIFDDLGLRARLGLAAMQEGNQTNNRQLLGPLPARQFAARAQNKHALGLGVGGSVAVGPGCQWVYVGVISMSRDRGVTTTHAIWIGAVLQGLFIV